MMKLRITSLRRCRSFTLSSSPLLIWSLLRRMSWNTKSSITLMFLFSRASMPTSRRLLTLHKTSTYLQNTMQLASSKASLKRAPSSSDPDRVSSSTPNPTLKIESSVAFIRRSCMSKTPAASAASEIFCASFAAVDLNATLLKFRRTLAENSRLASFRWWRHFSPSTAKIPSPNRSLMTV